MKQNYTKYKKKDSKQKTKKLKPMNCSPSVKGLSPIRDSCFTPSILEKIRDAYNKHHPDSIIEKNESNQIWYELKARLSRCEREDCWLNEIKDKNVRKKLEKYIFAPHQPKEWKENKDAWLSNFDIFEVLRQYEISHKHFKIIGPTPIDFDTRPKDMNEQCVWEELCSFSLKHQIEQKKTKIGVVFNLDKHDEPGSHWVSLFIDIDNKFLFYLDSAGEEIKPEIKVFVERIKKQGKEMANKIHFNFYENYPFEHQMGENECGMYSLFFIITMLTHRIEEPGKKTKIFKNHNQIIHMFKKRRIPDRYMNKYRNVLFNP
jgi:hypothetical protein